MQALLLLQDLLNSNPPHLPPPPRPQSDPETQALCRALVQQGRLAAVQKALNNRIGSSYSGEGLGWPPSRVQHPASRVVRGRGPATVKLA